MQTTDGATPLWIACQEGHQAVVGLLLDRGADVNQAEVRCGGGEGACGVLDGMWVVMRAGVQLWGARIVCVGRVVYSVCGAWGVGGGRDGWGHGVSCVWVASLCRQGVLVVEGPCMCTGGAVMDSVSG